MSFQNIWSCISFTNFCWGHRCLKIQCNSNYGLTLCLSSKVIFSTNFPTVFTFSGVENVINSVTRLHLYLSGACLLNIPWESGSLSSGVFMWSLFTDDYGNSNGDLRKICDWCVIIGGGGFLFYVATAHSGSGPPHNHGFTIILKHTTIGKNPLDEWSARRRDLWQQTTFIRYRHPCPWRDSNPHSQQACGSRPTP